jgi:hypothetical protein
MFKASVEVTVPLRLTSAAMAWSPVKEAEPEKD